MVIMKDYESTHPWITFSIKLSSSPRLWMLLGEARSKCEHLAGVPLRPETARELHRIYLVKGAHATTAIEGNTLTEEEIRGRLEGRTRLPASREYLGTEVDNVIRLLDEITNATVAGKRLPLDRSRLEYLNGEVLSGLRLDEDVVPGRIRTHDVVVGRYRAAPWRDCPELVDRLCEWLSGDYFAPTMGDGDEGAFSKVVIKAVVAHLYIAWIHPFGDGNGRTARLVEHQILAQSGMVPIPAANLLSDHYNLTRTRYYEELDTASREGGDVNAFLEYAVEGFVDGLREQIARVRDQQVQVAWENFVHEKFRGRETKAMQRRLHLVLDLPASPVPRHELRLVTPRVAAEYAGRGEKTLSRDIGFLLGEGLIRRDRGGYLPNREIILAFLPPVMAPDGG